MSGHSKWNSIKHQKGVTDARRGQLFTKLTKEIIMAVREGGGNPETNYRLRLAVQKAKDKNMPSILVEFVLEGYGPGGAAILVDILTDNRNRAVQEIRNAFTKSGGNLGESGSVAWQFEQKGLIIVETDGQDAEEMALQAIDAGADDVNTEKDYIEIYTQPKELEALKNKLESQGVKICSAELANIPKNTVDLDGSVATQVLRLLNKLEELEDTKSVCSNVDFSEEALAKFEAQS